MMLKNRPFRYLSGLIALFYLSGTCEAMHKSIDANDLKRRLREKKIGCLTQSEIQRMSVRKLVALEEILADGSYQEDESSSAEEASCHETRIISPSDYQYFDNSSEIIDSLSEGEQGTASSTRNTVEKKEQLERVSRKTSGGKKAQQTIKDILDVSRAQRQLIEWEACLALVQEFGLYHPFIQWSIDNKDLLSLDQMKQIFTMLIDVERIETASFSTVLKKKHIRKKLGAKKPTNKSSGVQQAGIYFGLLLEFATTYSDKLFDEVSVHLCGYEMGHLPKMLNRALTIHPRADDLNTELSKLMLGALELQEFKPLISRLKELLHELLAKEVNLKHEDSILYLTEILQERNLPDMLIFEAYASCRAAQLPDDMFEALLARAEKLDRVYMEKDLEEPSESALVSLARWGQQNFARGMNGEALCRLSSKSFEKVKTLQPEDTPFVQEAPSRYHTKQELKEAQETIENVLSSAQATGQFLQWKSCLKMVKEFGLYDPFVQWTINWSHLLSLEEVKEVLMMLLAEQDLKTAIFYQPIAKKKKYPTLDRKTKQMIKELHTKIEGFQQDIKKSYRELRRHEWSVDLLKQEIKSSSTTEKRFEKKLQDHLVQIEQLKETIQHLQEQVDSNQSEAQRLRSQPKKVEKDTKIQKYLDHKSGFRPAGAYFELLLDVASTYSDKLFEEVSVALKGYQTGDLPEIIDIAIATHPKAPDHESNLSKLLRDALDFQEREPLLAQLRATLEEMYEEKEVDEEDKDNLDAALECLDGILESQELTDDLLFDAYASVHGAQLPDSILQALMNRARQLDLKYGSRRLIAIEDSAIGLLDKWALKNYALEKTETDEDVLPRLSYKCFLQIRATEEVKVKLTLITKMYNQRAKNVLNHTVLTSEKVKFFREEGIL